MNEAFLKSVASIRHESIGMLKNLRSVKGDDYARLVHAIILADQIESVSTIFVESTTPESRELAQALATAQINMVAQIMNYFTRCTQFSDESLADAFNDAGLFQRKANDLISKAKDMSESGKVMGE